MLRDSLKLRESVLGREKYFWVSGDFKRPVISGGGVRLMVGSPEGPPLITIFRVPDPDLSRVANEIGHF